MTHSSFPPLAALFAFSSLGGILLPSTYARETLIYAAQGIGQDWVDLIVVTPTHLQEAPRTEASGVSPVTS